MLANLLNLQPHIIMAVR